MNNDIIKPISVIHGKANLFYEGMITRTNQGDLVKIIKYVNDKNVYIEFVEYPGYVDKTTMYQIYTGGIRNKLELNMYDGYFGLGQYESSGIYEKTFNTWYSMLSRVKLKPEYKNVKIYCDWYDYQLFAKWFFPKVSKLNNNFKLTLDKDIKQIGIHPKLYGPYTCMIIPEELNLMVSNIYINKPNGLPFGVYKECNKYRPKSQPKLNNLTQHKTRFDNPMEAFEVYRTDKILYFKERATWYYNNGGLLKEDYDYIMNSFNILPFGN